MKTKQSSLKKTKKTTSQVTIGIDIGDQWSHYCTLNDTGDVIEEGRFRTTAGALAKHFADIASVRIAIENGTHSIRIQRTSSWIWPRSHCGERSRAARHLSQ